MDLKQFVTMNATGFPNFSILMASGAVLVVLPPDMPIATITFQYQEGPNAGQTSYQLLPEQAAELKRALAALVD